jgi:hypothetical protein
MISQYSSLVLDKRVLGRYLDARRIGTCVFPVCRADCSLGASKAGSPNKDSEFWVASGRELRYMGLTCIVAIVEPFIVREDIGSGITQRSLGFNEQRAKRKVDDAKTCDTPLTLMVGLVAIVLKTEMSTS